MTIFVCKYEEMTKRELKVFFQISIVFSLFCLVILQHKCIYKKHIPNNLSDQSRSSGRLVLPVSR